MCPGRELANENGLMLMLMRCWCWVDVYTDDDLRLQWNGAWMALEWRLQHALGKLIDCEYVNDATCEFAFDRCGTFADALRTCDGPSGALIIISTIMSGNKNFKFTTKFKCPTTDGCSGPLWPCPVIYCVYSALPSANLNLLGPSSFQVARYKFQMLSRRSGRNH